MSGLGQPVPPGVDPTQWDQYQQQMQRQKMAQALMGNNAQGAYGGLANIGGDLAGAYAIKQMQQRSDPENQVVQQRYNMTPDQAQNVLSPSLLSRAGTWASNLFGLGGSS